MILFLTTQVIETIILTFSIIEVTLFFLVFILNSELQSFNGFYVTLFIRDMVYH